MKYTLFLVCAMTVSGCPSHNPKTPIRDVMLMCKKACERVNSLGCLGEDSGLCEVTCVTTELHGYDTMHPECLVSVESCEEASYFSKFGCDV